MIKYDLQCRKGHVFEAWFRDSTAYDEQVEDGEIACPHCRSRKVEKAVMAPRLGKGGKDAATRAQQVAAMRAQLSELRQKVEANCDDVGTQFAEEARKIHYGEVEARGIYGETTPDEAEALTEEGVPFARIPWAPKENA